MRRSHVTLGVILRNLVIGGVILGFVGYVLWQSRIFIQGPVITVTSAPPATTTAAFVELAGRAENIVWIHLNGRPIVTTPSGEFRERIVLEKGYTVLQLEAADRFGRRTSETFSVQPRQKATSSPNQHTQ